MVRTVVHSRRPRSPQRVDIATVIVAIPRRLKATIIRAVPEGQSFNATVVRALCWRYNVPVPDVAWKRSGQSRRATSTVTLRVPEEVRRALMHEAVDAGQSLRDRVIDVLHEEFDG